MSDKSLRFEWTCWPSLVPDGQKSCLRKWRYSLNGAWSQWLLNLNMKWVYYSPICSINSIHIGIPYSLESLFTYLLLSRFYFLFNLYLILTFVNIYIKHKHIYLCILKQAQDHFKSFGHLSSNHIVICTSRIKYQMSLFLYSSKPQKHIFSLIDWLKGY